AIAGAGHHDGVLVSGLPPAPTVLFPAVPEVARVADHGQREVGTRTLVVTAHVVRRVLAGVVGDEHPLDTWDELPRDAVEHLRERRGRVVRDDEHREPLRSWHRARRLPPLPSLAVGRLTRPPPHPS